MAEIHVERKRGARAWVWILLVVIILVAVGWYCWHAGYIHLSLSSWTDQKLAFLNVGGMHGT
jgi:drug/metabolite transporter (DMT)-like permease